MFTKLRKAWTIATNSANIKYVLESVYNVVVKMDTVLSVLTPELGFIPKTSPIIAYIPLLKTALGVIKNVIEKFGPIVGFETIVYAQSDENPADALKAAIKELNAVVEGIK